ncbi:hypothetical protein EV361DRAFT_99926 [Lentinula raphanica]|nr:hypothetical protein EV361DRAFT_99926 [Lentinula raphanica]
MVHSRSTLTALLIAGAASCVVAFPLSQSRPSYTMISTTTPGPDNGRVETDLAMVYDPTKEAYDSDSSLISGPTKFHEEYAVSEGSGMELSDPSISLVNSDVHVQDVRVMARAEEMPSPVVAEYWSQKPKANFHGGDPKPNPEEDCGTKDKKQRSCIPNNRQVVSEAIERTERGYNY